MVASVELLTAEDVEKLPSDLRCELIDGILIKLEYATWTHGLVTANLIGLVGRCLKHGDTRRALASCGFILRRNPDTVRAADVSITQADEPRRATGYPEDPPALIAEVIDEWDRPAEIQARIHDWVEFGVGLIWLVNPQSRTVQVIRSLRDRIELGDDDILTGDDVIPGFSCQVSELFE